MSLYLGIDTSNYTTSAALYNTETGKAIHKKKLLPVKEGERGIRQSDAVFHHTQQLSEIIGELFSEARKAYENKIPEISAVGVSTRPRSVEGSYMPCFTVGINVARSVATVLGVPCYEFSHQDGHVAAALYSAGRLELLSDEFLAFHVSGGTTESLLVKPGENGLPEIELIGTSTDLKAGQAIDRVGVMMGLKFPCGPEMEKLALKSNRKFKIKPSVRGFDCSLSGVENKCRKMFDDKETPSDIALFCIKYVEASLESMAASLIEKYPGYHILFSGGVMSNSIIREDFLKKFDCSFALPEFSSDNAAGISVLASIKDRQRER